MVSRSGSRSTRLLVVALVAASLAIITLDYRQGDAGPLAGMGRAAQTLMAPLQEGVTTATRPVGDFFSALAHLPSMARENQDLKQQLVDAQTRIAGDAQQQLELQQLRDLLHLSLSLDPNAVPAVVIGHGLSNFDYSITLDKGANDGVRVGQPVVTGSAGSPRLVGQVVSVTPISSDVQLVIDRNFAVAGGLATSGETGLVTGQGDQDLTMDGIPAGTKYPEGQPEYVFTVTYDIGGQHGRYPPDILIGEVSSVHEGSNALETDVSISPAVDFSALEFVLVLQTPTGDTTP
ncbi:MAG: rod shape-determining protein MreC [Actinomycetota bacterium]